MPDDHRAQDSQELRRLWKTIRELAAVEELLAWDQETYLPLEAHASRGDQLATIASLRHRCLASDELADALDRCAAGSGDDPRLGAEVREARRAHQRARSVSESTTACLARATSRALQAWQRARDEDDFDLFAPALNEVIELKRLEASEICQQRPELESYDALLEEYEPGARKAQLLPLFTELAERLSQLVQDAASSGVVIDQEMARGRFSLDRQRQLGRHLAERLGFDFDRGRLDRSTHPFCVGLHPSDVRITWRPDENDFRPAVFGILHEVGHALYEQGLPEDWRDTAIGDAASMGIHESQSRLWENHVGRSTGFWVWALPQYQQAFPELRARSAEQLAPLLHAVEPSLIRVDADETTYNLHIIARFELECALVEGQLAISELPEAWRETYRRLLGVAPESDRDGALQDIHWASGLFGYFPTYTLGTVLSAQLFARAERDLGDLDEHFAAGRFQPLLFWLRDRVHRHASRWTPPELIRRATGEALSATPFLDYITHNVQRLYG